MRENRPYGSEGGASQTNGTSLPPIVGTPQAALIRRKLLTIGVGGTDYIPFPLPPNRTGSSPVYAKTVCENRRDTATCATASESSEKQCSSSVVGYDHGTGPYQFGSPQGLVCSVSCACFVSEDQRSGDPS